MKFCSRCRKEKPISAFGRNSRSKDGLYAFCKICASEAARAWRKANPDRDRENRKRRYQSNPKKFKEASSEWRAAHPEKVHDQNKKWRLENREKALQNARDWYRNNKARARVVNQRWYDNNREKARDNARRRYRDNIEYFRAKARLWKSKNKDKVRSYALKWRSANPEIAVFNNRRQQAKARGIPFKLEREQFLDWLSRQAKSCTYCGVAEEVSFMIFGRRLDLDRMDNNRGYVLDNVCLACHICNTTKGAWLSFSDMQRIANDSVKQTWRELQAQSGGRITSRTAAARQ